MVAIPRQVDPPDADTLREQAADLTAAAADLAAQIEAVARLGQPHLVLAADTPDGPLRFTLSTRDVAQALGARLAILQQVAAGFTANARALEAHGARGLGQD